MSQAKIFAHRGVSSQFPENTMSAFQAAVSCADGIEFDVQLTKDHVPVIIHDLFLGRTVSGTGYIRDYTYDELKSLSAGAWFHPDFEKERIPTLIELFDWAKNHSLLLNIELKSYVWDRDLITTIVLPLIVQYQFSHRVIISSFDHKLIHLIQQQNSSIETAVLVEAALYEPVNYLKKIGAGSYHFRSGCLLEEEAKELMDQGIRLRPYTVNEPEWMERYLSWGVDAIFTDLPNKLDRCLPNRS